MQVNHDREALLASCLAVSQRAAQTLEWAKAAKKDILSIALDHLTLARAALYATCLQASAPPPEAEQHSAAALDFLRRANHQEMITRGLLTRALLRGLQHRLTGPDSAAEALDEAWDIAERGPMPLFQADIHLHRARLFGHLPPRASDSVLETEPVCAYPWQSPAEDLTAARRLIDKHSYGRRKQEWADAEAAILR